LSRWNRPPADKAAAVSPQACAKAQAWLPSKPKPVARRQARDCWRLDDRKVVRRLREPPAETPGSKGPRSACRRVFPRRALGSPKMVLLRVLVTRTSVVETNSRHLGNARKWIREVKRAAAPSDVEGCRPGRGRPSFTPQKGVSGMQRAKARRVLHRSGVP
jgi:hypothetical protein